MNPDTIAAIVFAVILGIFLLVKRKRLTLQRALFPIIYVVMYKSKWGVDWMEKVAKKYPRLVRIFGDVGIVLGFLGMALITFELIWSSVKVFIGGAAPGIAPVLPVQADGIFFVPFSYWIISIFLLAIAHEFSHGMLSFVHRVPVKSSGFAFLCLVLPVVPAAFVEPDEEVLNRKSKRARLAVFAAGPMANMVFALLALGLFFAASPVLNSAYSPVGVEVVTVQDGSRAALAGLPVGEIITHIDGERVLNVKEMSSKLENRDAGEVVSLKTQNSLFSVVLNESKTLGISARPFSVPNSEFVNSYGNWAPPVVKWTSGLLFWLFMLNLGIGLFNLLPLGPLDGGRMFQLVCLKVSKKYGLRVWSFVSFALAALIIVNIVLGFIK